MTYKSNLEEQFAAELSNRNIEFKYESIDLLYTIKKTYKPDFILPNGIIIETKGRFTAQERAKHLQVRKENPTKDIRFVFGSDNKLTNAPKSQRYSEWCEKHNYKYIIWYFPKRPKPGWRDPKEILKQWLEEER